MLAGLRVDVGAGSRVDDRNRKRAHCFVDAAREQRPWNVEPSLHVMTPGCKATVAPDADHRGDESVNDRQRLFVLRDVALLRAVEKRTELEARAVRNYTRAQNAALDP